MLWDIHDLTFESPAHTLLTDGGVSTVWTPALVMRGRVRVKMVNTTNAAGGVLPQATYRVYIFGLPAVSEDMRIVWHENILTIVGIINSNNHHLEIDCTLDGEE